MNTIIYGEDFNHIYRTLCYIIIEEPDFKTEPRGMKIYELINASVVLGNIQRRELTIPERKYSNKYLGGELCWYLSGSLELKPILHYSKFWKKVSDDGIRVNSNYGYYIFHQQLFPGISQFEYAANCLIADKDSRKAVIFIYQPEHHSYESKDNPCTQYMQFFIRNNRLHLIVHMRSNDIWFGLAYDLPFFTIIQEIMYVVLKKSYPELALGRYTHNAGSLHLYEKDFEAAKSIAEFPRYELSPQWPNVSISTIQDIPDLLKNEEKLRTTEGYAMPRFVDHFLDKIAQYVTGADE